MTRRYHLDLRRRPSRPPPLPTLDAFRHGARSLPPDVEALDLLGSMVFETPPTADIAVPNERQRSAGCSDRRLDAWLLRSSPTSAPERSSRKTMLPSLLAALPLALAPATGLAGSGGSGRAVHRRVDDGTDGPDLPARFQLHLPSPALPRLEVSSPAEDAGPEPRSGVPALAVGIPLAAAGGVLLGVGIGTAAAYSCSSYGYSSYCSSYSYYYARYYVPPIIAGAAMLGVGIPLTVIGTVLEKERKEWKRNQVVLAGGQVRVGPAGWSGEVRFRF